MRDYLFNTKNILSRARHPWIDYARGICIILVLYRHVFEGLANVGPGSNSYPVLSYLNIFLFSFKMPLFFIVSGIFLGNSLQRKGLDNYIRDRFQTVFYPLLIWGSIQVTIQLLLPAYTHTKRDMMGYMYLLFYPRQLQQFWYLNALFFVGSLYAIIKVYGRLKTWHQLVLGLLFYATSLYCYHNQIFIGFLQDVLFFYVFYALGDAISDYMLDARNYKFHSSWQLLLVLTPIFVVLQHYFVEKGIKYQEDFYAHAGSPIAYVRDTFMLIAGMLVGDAFILSLSFVLARLNIFRFLRVIGYHSLYIYVVHLIITGGTRALLVNILHIENVPFILFTSIFLGVVGSMIVYNLAQKAGMWWLFILKKPEPAGSRTLQPVYAASAMVTPKESITEPVEAEGPAESPSAPKD